jgi:hypothetical protein
MLLLGRASLVGGQEAPSNYSPDESAVKAADLYAFGLHIDWPKETLDATPGQFLIGIVGQDPFGDALDFIAKRKKIQGRTIVIRRFPSPEQYQGVCQIVFISHSLTPEQQAAAIRKIGRVGVLLVGETPGFAKQGGTANFYLEGNRVKFEINGEAAKRARLQPDAMLLNVATPIAVESRGLKVEIR